MCKFTHGFSTCINLDILIIYGKDPDFKGGGNILKHLYLNDYAELDNKISYVLFLHA